RTQLAGWRWEVEAVRDPLVLDAFRQVPRHRFVSDALVTYAYEDRPLPIGYGQTISQPYIVAKMTEVVEPRKRHRALEIGTVGLPGCDTLAVSGRRLHHRDHRTPWCHGPRASRRAGAQECGGAGRRWVLRLARESAF